MPPLWNRYSQRFIHSILHPQNIGFFHDNTHSHQEMRVVTGSSGDILEGNRVLFSWIVNSTNGVIVDAKFQAYGETALIGASDIACDLILHKNYARAKNLNVDLIKDLLYETQEPLPKLNELTLYLNLIVDAIEVASTKCLDIPLVEFSSPSLELEEMEGEEHPDWPHLSFNERFTLIQELIREEIQPYIALDGGAIELLAFNNDRDVVIAYHGACATCPAATGSTLDTIQNILRLRLSPNLRVIPDPSFLK